LFLCLLPEEFRLTDPQRVCNDCHKNLEPLQSSLSHSIANHQRENTIILSSDSFFDTMKRYLNMPCAFTLGREIRKAAYSVHNLLAQQHCNDHVIPLRAMNESKSLLFLTIIKGGLFIAPHIGSGLFLNRLEDGTWSAPCAVTSFGLGAGFLIGADVVDCIFIFDSNLSTDFVAGLCQFNFGIEADVTVALLGRYAHDILSLHVHAHGLYVSLHV
jgi:lipid-binding SYLF domain-containing protein